MSDEELIERIRQGDRNAADELIRRYNPLIFRYCLYRCGNKETAEDLTQETFLRLIKYLPKYKNCGRLKTYLFSIANRLCIDENKQNRSGPLPAEKEQPIGVYGQRHLRYLKQYRRITYTNLLTSGKLNAYLAEIDGQAKELFFRLVKEYADRQGVTERLKADNPLEWVQRMNNIRSAVEEVINTELIFA